MFYDISDVIPYLPKTGFSPSVSSRTGRWRLRARGPLPAGQFSAWGGQDAGGSPGG